MRADHRLRRHCGVPLRGLAVDLGRGGAELVGEPERERLADADADRPTQKPKPGQVVIAADSAYGPMLYDATGQPIYLFTAERGGPPGLLRRVCGRLAAGPHPR